MGYLRFAPSVDISLSSYYSACTFPSLRYEPQHKTSLITRKPSSFTYQMDAPGADEKNIRSRQEDPFSWLIKRKCLVKNCPEEWTIRLCVCRRACTVLASHCLQYFVFVINPLNPELNPICCLLALLGAHHFLHVSRIRFKLLTFRLLMSYIYIYIPSAICWHYQELTIFPRQQDKV